MEWKYNNEVCIDIIFMIEKYVKISSSRQFFLLFVIIFILNQQNTVVQRKGLAYTIVMYKITKLLMLKNVQFLT